MLKIQVMSEKIDTRSGLAKGSGNPYSIHSQFAYISLSN